MSVEPRAPGVPVDYYESIHAAELDHWWHTGMWQVSLALLGGRAAAPAGALLDAGCGTGGFLLRAEQLGAFDHLAGVDLGAEAIELARGRVPAAAFSVAPLDRLPFDDGAFDLVVTNDVLQHVDEPVLGQSAAELRRVVKPGGALLVRTNGARHARRERSDWRAFDRASLSQLLENASFVVERVTYTNVVPSLWASFRHREPHAPTDERHGIPLAAAHPQSAVASRLLALEARYLERPSRALPYGHTLVALATPA